MNNHWEQKQHSLLDFSDVEELNLLYNDLEMTLIPACRLIKFHHVISPRDGYKSFPRCYFDEKTVSISDDFIEQISVLFDRLFQTGTPEINLPLLPPGASYEAYMQITMKRNKILYYTAHTTFDGSFIHADPVAPEYLQLAHLLRKPCSFPKYVPQGFPASLSHELRINTNEVTKADCTNSFVGYRFFLPATGVFGYDYYWLNERICSVSSAAIRSAPTMILGGGIDWRSDSVANITATRTIHDESSGKQLFKIVYKSWGQYEINESITVCFHGGRYSFYSGHDVIATIHNKFNDERSFDLIDDYVQCLDVVASNNIPVELLFAIFAFPLLRFGH